MADVSTSDIDGYAKYLKSQGVSDTDVQGYTKYLASQHGVDHPSDVQESLPKRLLRSTIDQGVPVVGAMAAGALAAPETGFVGTVPAGAMGYAAGKQLARILDQYVLGDKPEAKGVGGALSQSAVDLKNGAMFEMGGQIVGAAPGLVKDGVSGVGTLVKNQLGKGVEFTPAANKGAIESAGEALGLSVPKALLTDNPTYQKLESGLSQSGSLPAKSVRNQYNEFFKGLDSASAKVEDLKTPQSNFSLGSSLKSDTADQINKLRAPVSEMYQDLTPSLQKIPVDKGTVNQTFGALKRNPLFQTKDGLEMLEQYKSAVLQQPELNSLKELRSNISDAVAPGSAPIDAKRAEAIQSAVTAVRDRSISAMKNQLPKEFHPEVDNVIDQITLADKAHQSNIEDLNSIKGLIGSKGVKSPVSFLNKLGDVKEEDLANRAANLDVGSLQSLKDKFPSVFEKTQAAKINDMVQSSTNAVSGFSLPRFMKQYQGMGQELKDLIFTPEMQNHIENLQTLKQAIPPKLGPSGTPEGQMLMDMFNPKRNALDLGVKKVLDGASEQAPQSVARFSNPETLSLSDKLNANKTGRVLDLIKTRDVVPAITSPAAAASEPTKGPDKWATDGLKKLIDHSKDDETKQLLQDGKSSMLEDKQTKSMLIAASDLTPGSKAMEAMLSKIKSRIDKDKK